MSNKDSLFHPLHARSAFVVVVVGERERGFGLNETTYALTSVPPQKKTKKQELFWRSLGERRGGGEGLRN
jgi:hypothetical protein